MALKEKYDFNFDGKTVLVVEDNLINYMLVSTMLKPYKPELIHADDGHKAIEICRNNSNLDLVLMDMQLPGIDGIKATREIKMIRPDLTIIAATASIDEEDEAAFKEAGCSAFISKPFHLRKLIELMHSFLGPED